VARKVLTQSRERSAGLDDKDPGPVHRRHLLEQIDQQRGLAGTDQAAPFFLDCRA
jgi:hypothetical protein